MPSAPVEASIALSIVFVAAEILHPREGLARSRPWTVAFAFGLLHGLGFAGALSQALYFDRTMMFDADTEARVRGLTLDEVNQAVRDRIDRWAE